MEKDVSKVILSELQSIRNEMATKDDIVAIREEMATKEDLAAVRDEMATKKELDTSILSLKADMLIMRQDMATKYDLLEIRSEMATKDDIFDMATKKDIKNISRKLDDLITNNNKQHLRLSEIAQEMAQITIDESKKEYEELKSRFFNDLVV